MSRMPTRPCTMREFIETIHRYPSLTASGSVQSRQRGESWAYINFNVGRGSGVERIALVEVHENGKAKCWIKKRSHLSTGE